MVRFLQGILSSNAPTGSAVPKDIDSFQQTIGNFEISDKIVAITEAIIAVLEEAQSIKNLSTSILKLRFMSAFKECNPTISLIDASALWCELVVNNLSPEAKEKIGPQIACGIKPSKPPAGFLR